MSSRHQRRADTAAFRRASGDLLVDLFAAGTSLHGRPHAGLKQRTLAYWGKGSYSPTSRHSALSVAGTSSRTRGSLVHF